MNFKDYIKKIFWTLSLPFFPYIRNLTRKLGYNPYPQRQPYLLGYLSPEKTPEEFKKYLKEKGFKRNIIAWIDNGELLSLRLLENFRYQYHIRLFNDGEIRGHHELTPEFSPFGHLHDEDTNEKREEFKKILGDWLTDSPPNLEK